MNGPVAPFRAMPDTHERARLTVRGTLAWPSTRRIQRGHMRLMAAGCLRCSGWRTASSPSCTGFFLSEFVFRARTTRHRGGHESKLRTVGSFLAWPPTLHAQYPPFLALRNDVPDHVISYVRTVTCQQVNISSIDCTVSKLLHGVLYLEAHVNDKKNCQAYTNILLYNMKRLMG
jgi:hypothetical protein